MRLLKRATEPRRRPEAHIAARLTLALALIVVGVVSIGALAWSAIGSLRTSVERWALIEAVDDARQHLQSVIADEARSDGMRFNQTKIDAAFSALNARIGRLRAFDETDRSLVLRASRSTEKARDAFERAVAEETRATEALAALDTVVERLSAQSSAQAGEVRWAAAQSANRSRALEASQREGYYRMRALMESSLAVERIRQRLDAFNRVDFRPSGAELLTSLGDLPADCGRAPTEAAAPCSPSTARLRAEMDALGRATSGAVSRAAVKKVSWAAEAYLRASNSAFAQLRRELDVAVDNAKTERERTAALYERERGLVRFNRAIIHARTLTDRLRRARLADFTQLNLGMRGALTQLRTRGAALFSAEAVGAPASTDMRAAVRAIEDAWTRALQAAEGRRRSARDMDAALTTMGREITAVIDRIRGSANHDIDVFASLTATVLISVVIAVILLAWIAYHRVARPLGQVTEAILSLARGDLGSRAGFRGQGHGRAFRRLFSAIESLRRANLERLDLVRSNADAELRLSRQRAEAAQLEIELREEQKKIDFFRRVISIVSHELRTPLSIIDGNARRVLRKAGAIEAGELAERMERVRSSVTRLTGMMDTFLLSAKIESGKLDFQPTEHDLRALVADACAQQAEATPSHRIEAELEGAPTRYLGDARLLRQAVANLLSNAVKYSPDADRVAIRCESVGDDVLISVRDWGIGIPKQDLKQLGAQFFRASNHGEIMGTGVGLHLVKSVADAHGGALSVESEVGAGSVFTIRLPRADMGTADDPAGDAELAA